MGGMHEPVDSEKSLFEAIEGLRKTAWSRGGVRAPHKPLLLLLALARHQQGLPRAALFGDIEKKLRGLLEAFSPPRASYHPEYPFWHLRSDGLWVVENPERFQPKRGGSSPRISLLRDAPAVGGLPTSLVALLRENPDLTARIARRLLEDHFPGTYHEDILQEVGLDLEAPTTTGCRQKRDPEFPMLVLRAYEYRCAVCGYDAQLDGKSVGLEAAHVRWHSHRGPSEVANGLCLCSLHHKALDIGGIGVSEDHRVLASSRMHGGAPTTELLLRFHGRKLRAPQAGAPALAAEHLRWHAEQVFRGPARAL